MIGRFLGWAIRIVYLGIAILGLSMVASGYPPSGSGPPVLLGIGGLLAIAGLAGMIWPEKIRSGTSGPD